MPDEEYELKDVGTRGAVREESWRALRSFVEAHYRLGMAVRVEVDRYGRAKAQTVEP